MASSGRRNSNTRILQELEELSESLYQTHTSTTSRRTASLALPRAAVSSTAADNAASAEARINPKPRIKRMSLSPWRSRPKLDEEDDRSAEANKDSADPSEGKSKWSDESAGAASGKKGIWNWKPMRALSHIGMQKLSCLFSVEVVSIQELPASMNGLRLSVCVRKRESRDGAVQTMPSRVAQGAAEFEETLFIRCHVYFTPGTGIPMKFEPRPFLIYAVAFDAEELDFGRTSVDLSRMIQDSVEKSFEGSRIRQWDTSLKLSGKAKGGEIVLKLGFQIMEKDGGIGIYSQSDSASKSGKSKTFSPSIARKQSKTSFSIPSPRLSSRADQSWTPSQARQVSDFHGIEELDLDSPVVPPPARPVPVPKPEPEQEPDDSDLPYFDVVDKGIEIDHNKHEEEEEDKQSEVSSGKVSYTSEVVKEVVRDQSHQARLTELDSIAWQIKALESMIGDEKPVKTDESMLQKLDADEDKVTREFLQMFEDVGESKTKISDDKLPIPHLGGYEKTEDLDMELFLPDLGKGLGCVVQTRDGGLLASMNPLDAKLVKKDTAKLAMQLSKPLILRSDTVGFEQFQRIAAIGLEEFGSEISSLMPMDEIKGKTAEQIAFEGLASQIIQGRNKEGASSTAARSMATLKSMIAAMNIGRKERISTGIWNVSEKPITADEIMASSLQRIENLALDGLKIQADLSEEDAPFAVSSLDADHVLTSAIPIEDWMKLKTPPDSTDESALATTLVVVVQLRDPLRQFEAVGGPMMALIHAKYVPEKVSPYKYNEEMKFRLSSLQVGGVKVGSAGCKNGWDSDKQRLTALQWLVAYGMGKAGKRSRRLGPNGPGVMWSLSSRVMADMWLKSMRNPDVMFRK